MSDQANHSIRKRERKEGRYKTGASERVGGSGEEEDEVVRDGRSEEMEAEDISMEGVGAEDRQREKAERSGGVGRRGGFIDGKGGEPRGEHDHSHRTGGGEEEEEETVEEVQQRERKMRDGKSEAMEVEDINRKRAGAEDRRREKMNESRDLGGSIKKEDGQLRGGEDSRKRARGGLDEETKEVVQKRERGIRDGRSEETEEKEINHKEEPAEEEARRKRTARSVDFGGSGGSTKREKDRNGCGSARMENTHGQEDLHIIRRRREKRPNTNNIKREWMAEATQEEVNQEDQEAYGGRGGPRPAEEGRSCGRLPNPQAIPVAIRSWIDRKMAAYGPKKRQKRPVVGKKAATQRAINRFQQAQRMGHEDIQRSQLVHTKERLVQPSFKPNLLIFGEQQIDIPFNSPFPAENKKYDVIFYCDVCMKFFASERTRTNHKNRCRSHYPPGDEIYRSVEDRISVFEVDGGVAEEYCKGLCLLGKCFIETKSVYDNVLNLFLFYVLMKRDKTGFKFVGFFSKEKQEPPFFAVGSIMLLPSYRGKGYGRFLIDLAYQLTKKLELGVAVSVERPFSDLGSLTINSFWRSAILEYFYSRGQGTKWELDDIVKATGIADKEVMEVLKSLGFLRGKGKKKKISPKWEVVEEQYKKAINNNNRIWFNSDDLRWTPFRERSTEMDGQETLDDEEYGSLEDVEEQGIPGERKARSWAAVPAMGNTLEFPKEILKADPEFDDIEEPILDEEPKRFGILPIELSEKIDRLTRPKTPPVKSDSDSDDDWPPLPIGPDGRRYIPTKGLPTKGPYQKNATPSVNPDSMDVDSEDVGHSQPPDEEYEDDEVDAPKEVYSDHLSYKILEIMQTNPSRTEKKDTVSSLEFTTSKPAIKKEKATEAPKSRCDLFESEVVPTDRSVSHSMGASEGHGLSQPPGDDHADEDMFFQQKVQGEEVKTPASEIQRDFNPEQQVKLVQKLSPRNDKESASSVPSPTSKPVAKKEKASEAPKSRRELFESEGGPTDRSVSQLMESSEGQGHPEPVGEDCEEEEIVFLGKVQVEKSKKPAKELKTGDGLSEKPVNLVQKKPSIRRWKVPRHPPSLQLRLALLGRTRGKAVPSGQLVDASEGQGLTEPPGEDHEDEATSVEPTQVNLVEKQSPRRETESTASFVVSTTSKVVVKKENTSEAPNSLQDVVESEGGPTDHSVFQFMEAFEGQGHPEPAEEDCEDEEIVFLRKVQGEKAKTPESDQLPEKKLKLVEKKPSRREKESSGFSHVSTTSKTINNKKKKAPEPIEPPPLKKQPVTKNILSLFSASTTSDLGCISTDGLNLRIPMKEKPIEKKDIPKEKPSEKEDVPEDPQGRAITYSPGIAPPPSNQQGAPVRNERSSEVDSVDRSVADSTNGDVEVNGYDEQSHRTNNAREASRGNYAEPRESSASGRSYHQSHSSRERSGFVDGHSRYRIGYDEREHRDRSDRSHHESRHSRDRKRHSGGYSGSYYDNHSSQKEDPEDPQSRAITDSRGFVPSSSNQHPDLLRSSEVDSMKRSVADSRTRDVEMYEYEHSRRRGDERQPRRGNYDEPRESSASGRWDHGSRERRGYYRIGYDDREHRDRSDRSYQESHSSRDRRRHSGGYSDSYYDSHNRTDHTGDHSRSFGHSEYPSICSHDDSSHSSRDRGDHSGGQCHSYHSNRESWHHSDDYNESNDSWRYPTGHSNDYSEFHSVGSHHDGSISWDRGGHSDDHYAFSNDQSHSSWNRGDHGSYRDRYDAWETASGYRSAGFNHNDYSGGYSHDDNQNRYGNNSSLERGCQYRQDEREAGYGGIDDHLANNSGYSYERDREGHRSGYDERDGRGDYAADFSYSSTADSRSDYHHSYKYRDSRRG